ncbi:Hypothetical predicted protein [Mytilus galloprovincialis]|uniref:Uncharacterized protein n=1 Tax=Mytilus galloprovincialis TaxID=29158 RepID=A0A8B6CIR5_MYTGA|nr:Hypothetical predicted protein [Mytilus galloprovincialis]
MSDRIYNRVETNDSTPDNNRPSFCHRHWKKAIISLILFIVAGVVVVAVVVTQTTNNSTSPTTFSKLTDENASNKCLYYTPERSDSVNKTCNIDKHESSSHLCEKCTDGSLLPSFCFCDKKVHCVNDKKYGGRAADDSKKTCNWCADVFINQFNHRGNASCSRASQAVQVKFKKMFHEIETIWKILPLPKFHGFQCRRKKRPENVQPGCYPLIEER